MQAAQDNEDQQRFAAGTKHCQGRGAPSRHLWSNAADQLHPAAGNSGNRLSSASLTLGALHPPSSSAASACTAQGGPACAALLSGRGRHTQSACGADFPAPGKQPGGSRAAWQRLWPGHLLLEDCAVCSAIWTAIKCASLPFTAVQVTHHCPVGCRVASRLLVALLAGRGTAYGLGGSAMRLTSANFRVFFALPMVATLCRTGRSSLALEMGKQQQGPTAEGRPAPPAAE